jgi:Na+-transporting NADH:ubiquinone oxidoreductase subunit C
MQKGSVKQVIQIVLGVSLICSLFVSAAAILLHATQRHNQRLDRIRNILIVADLYEEGADLDAIYEQKIEPLMIELQSGKIVDEEKFDETLNVESFDIKTLAFDPDHGEVIPPQYDEAKIKQRPRYMVVYLVKDGPQLQKLVLPVYGRGLWSTLYGFIALDQDLRTITGITFYDHKETPGLGEVDPGSDQADHQISGLSGATITSRGVSNLVRYWLGEHGYGPFLNHLGQGQMRENFVHGSGSE